MVQHGAAPRTVIKIIGDDIWDPNNWVEDDHEHRIYASDDLEIYAVVDAIDYPYLCQFKWSVHDKKKAERGYVYLRRALHEGLGPGGQYYESPITGRWVRDKKRVQRNKFLHTEIMERTGIPKPSLKHREVDHGDRRTLNCRRRNLTWATRSMNVRNSSSVIRLQNLRRRGRISITTLRAQTQ